MKAKCYIWINPVVAGMYPPELLNDLLVRHGCQAVQCSGDWITEVQEKYKALTAAESRIVVDARCPMAVDLVQRLRGEQPLRVAEVEPILIHAARELAGRADLADRPKLITTPCAALAEQGNRLQLEKTRFIAWNRLLQEWGETPPSVRLEQSPIPPGFFDETGIRVHKVTGAEAIAAYVRTCPRDREQLVEMLYCPEGCHNGDGVQV